MPFLRCVYSGDVASREDIMRAFSSTSAEILKKPEAVTFVQVEHSPNLYFAQSQEPCAIVNIESIGGDFEKLVGPLTDILETVAGVSKSRVFLNFRDVSSEHWGFHGVTIAQLHSK